MSSRGDAAIDARNGSDRRVSRTRATLLASFDRLLLANGYEKVRVSDLTADADIGRSTFYEHFEGKHDLLETSVARVLSAIATAANRTSNDALLELLEHIGTQRGLARSLLGGSTRAILIRVLARELERQLAAHARTSVAPPIAPLAFLALSLANGQLGAIDAWLGFEDRCDVRMAARCYKRLPAPAWWRRLDRASRRNRVRH